MNEFGPYMVSRIKRWVIRRRWRTATAIIMSQNRFLFRFREIHAWYAFRRLGAVMATYVRTIQPIWRAIQEEKAAIRIQSIYRMHGPYKRFDSFMCSPFSFSSFLTW